MSRYTLIILLALIICPQTLFAQRYTTHVNPDTTKLYPPKVVIKDTSLANYVKKLKHAVARKDTNLLRPLLDTNIECSFGGDLGWEGIRNLWHPEMKNTELWLTLNILLSIGPATDSGQTSLVYPYVFTLPQGYDPFLTYVITDSNVNLHEKPDANSKVVTKLSYDIVSQYDTDGTVKELEEKDPLNPLGGWKWYHIRTIDRQYSGYVYWNKIWSPVDYRLFIENEDGKWLMKYFVGGD